MPVDVTEAADVQEPALADFVSKRLRDLRELSRLSPSDLARKSGIDRSNISRIESGKHIPSLATLSQLAQAMNLRVSDFLSGVPPQTSDPRVFRAFGEADHLASEMSPPLATARGAIELLHTHIATSCDDRSLEYMKTAATAIERARIVLSRLLNSMKPEYADPSLVPRMVRMLYAEEAEKMGLSLEGGLRYFKVENSDFSASLEQGDVLTVNPTASWEVGDIILGWVAGEYAAFQSWATNLPQNCERYLVRTSASGRTAMSAEDQPILFGVITEIRRGRGFGAPTVA